MQIQIDNELRERLSRRANKIGFDSTEEYVIIILETVVDELEETDAEGDVESRLEDLGYLQ